MPTQSTDKVYKIIIAGPVGAGKTQAVHTLSDKAIVTTEEISSDAAKKIKKTTTVAMDYGVMQLATGEQVQLYGTPGQKRFDFMWDILSENASGLVLLLNATFAHPVQDLKDYIDNFLPVIKTTKMIVGVTHAENIVANLPQQLSEELLRQGILAEIMAVDARHKEQMTHLVNHLVHSIV